MRAVSPYLVGCVVLVTLAGCMPSWFEAREPWRHDAEEKCLAAGSVKESPSVAILKPIQGPGMCGADFPLKVAALGESALATASLSYADDLRPPGSVPNGSQFPPATSYSRPPSPVSSSPLPPQQGYAAPSYSPAPASSVPQTYSPPRTMMQEASPSYQPYSRPQASYGQQPMSLEPGQARATGQGAQRMQFPVESRDPAIVRDPMSDSGGYQPPPREAYSPSEYTPGEDPDEDAAARRAPATSAPYTTAPSQSPRLSPRRVPLGPARAPTLTTAAVTPAATLACPIVSALDRWIIDAVQPSANRWFGQPVTEIRQISAYSCRGMNGQPGAHISEHAFGNALDISAFVLADGRKITVEKGWKGTVEEQAFLHDVQLAACDQFTTVLAPGSNVYHYNHIHVDLMRRSSGRRICQPRAMSGEEVAARLQGKNGPMFAERQEWRPANVSYDRGVEREPLIERDNDPFAYRGPRNARDTTGSVPAKSKNALRNIIDDEYFLGDEGDEHVAPPKVAAPETATPRFSLPRIMAPAVVDTTKPQ